MTTYRGDADNALDLGNGIRRGMARLRIDGHEPARIHFSVEAWDMMADATNRLNATSSATGQATPMFGRTTRGAQILGLIAHLSEALPAGAFRIEATIPEPAGASLKVYIADNDSPVDVDAFADGHGEPLVDGGEQDITGEWNA